MFSPVPVDRLELRSARLAKLRRALDAGGFDAIIVSAAENVLYATGYESIPSFLNPRTEAAAIVTSDRLLLVVAAADFAPSVAEGMAVDDVYPYGRFYYSGDAPSAHASVRHETPAAALAQALHGLKPGNTLLEASRLSPASIATISAWTGAAGDASSFMLDVRATKLHAEIEMMRRAAHLAEQGIEAGLRAAAPGVTDREVGAAVASAMASGGALPRNVTVAGGPRSALADVLNAERPLQRGDLLRFDVGCSYYGYQSDMARTAVVGEPTSRQRDRYAALLAGQEAGMRRAVAGATGAEVFAAAVAEVERCGLSPFRRHHVGHAIGLAGYESPVIAPDSVEKLREGAVLCIETPYYEPGWGGMMVEDTGVVSRDGFELLTTIDRSLRIIDV